MNKNALIIHRYYKVRGGEDVFLDEVLLPQLKSLNRLKVDVLVWQPLSNFFEILAMILGLEKLRPSYFKVKHLLKSNKYQYVFLNNFIPTLSLAIPELLHQHGVKVFMWVHNSRAICANGLCFDGKNDCYNCFDQSSYYAFIKKCHTSYLKSIVYAFMYRNKRVLKYLKKAEIHYLAISNFAASFIKKAQLTPEVTKKIEVIYLPTPPINIEEPLDNKVTSFLNSFNSKYYLFAGRLSFEKGVDRILDLALSLPHKAFVISGSGPMENALKKKIYSRNLKNILIVKSSRGQLQNLYKWAEALIIPSRVKETFSMVIAESQAYGTPVVYPTGGGAEEAVKHFGRGGIAFDKFTGQDIPKTHSETKNLFLEQLQRLLS